MCINQRKKSRRRSSLTIAKIIVAAIATSLIPHSAAFAQGAAPSIAAPAGPSSGVGAASPGGASSAGTGGASATSGTSGSAGGVGVSGLSGSTGAANTLPPGPLTLDEVVALAVRTNSAVQLAQQRLAKANELVPQVTAQGRPQSQVDLLDDYTSYQASDVTIGNPIITNPTLPGGGQIPSVVDQSGATGSAYIGSGGGGNSLSGGVGSYAIGGFVGTGGTGSSPSGTGLPGSGSTPGVGASVGVGGSSSSPGSAASGTSSTPGISGSAGTAPYTGGASTGATGAPGSPAGSSTGGTSGGTTSASPSTGNNGGTSSNNGGTGITPSPSAGTTNGSTAPGNNGSATGNGASGNGNGGASNGTTGGANGANGNGANGGGTTGGSMANPGGAGTGVGGSGGVGGSDSSGAAGSSSALPHHDLPGIAVAALPSIVTEFMTQTGDSPSYDVATDLPPVGASDLSASSSEQSSGTQSAAGRGVTEQTASIHDISTHDAQPTDTSTGTPTTSSGTTGRNKNNFGGRLALTQFIDVFGLLRTAKDVETITRDFYGLDVQRIQNEVALATKNLYFNVLYANANVAVEQEQLAYANENVRVVQDRVTNKIASEFDLITAQTLQSNTIDALSEAQNEQSQANSNLAYLLGYPPDQLVQLATPATPPLDETIDLARSVRIAERQRPELRQADNNVTIAQRLVRLADETLKPVVGLVASAGYKDSAGIGDDEEDYAVGAEVSIPLDDGGATRARVRSAKDDLATQTTTRDELRLTVALEVRQAVINVQTAQVQVRTGLAGVALAKEAVRLANVRYQAGVGTLLDVTNALAQLALAQTNLASGQFAYQSSLAAYIRAIGSR